MKNAFDYLNDVKMDFGRYEEEKISEEEILTMKNKVAKKRISVKKVCAAALCAAVIAATCTAFASGYVTNIIKTLTTGHNIFYQYDPEALHELPEEIKGHIFDGEGNALTALPDDFDPADCFDEEGNRFTSESLSELFKSLLGDDVIDDSDYDPEESEYIFASVEEAQRVAVFDIKVPEYLPEGYALKKIYGFKDGDGNVSGEYINMVYEAGDKKIHIFERVINEQTAFETGAANLEEITLNGRRAVISDGESIDYETEDDVSVGIYAHGNITREELLKMAESTL